jgi:hypothetical protein
MFGIAPQLDRHPVSNRDQHAARVGAIERADVLDHRQGGLGVDGRHFGFFSLVFVRRSDVPNPKLLDRRLPIIIHESAQRATVRWENEGAPRGITEILAMISAIAASAIMVALVLLAETGFIISPRSVDAPAPETRREEELVRQIKQINEEFSPGFWRRYRDLRAKLAAEALVPDGPEHQELIQMTDQLELRHADRLRLLSELAKLRKTSLTEMMKHPDVLAHFHG